MKFVMITFALLFLSAKLQSQNISYAPLNNNFSVTLQMNYVSSASIQLYAFSPSEIERNIFQETRGGYGYSAILKTNVISENVSLALNFEYIKITDDENSIFLQTANGPSIRARMTETIEVMPVELSAIFNIPYLTDDLNVYLGGGGGVYFGDWRRSVLGVETETISKRPGISFHVLSGIQYSFLNNVSAGFEFRFREGMYEVNNEFKENEFLINGNSYSIQKSYNSKVFLDGLRLSLGVSYYF